MNKVQSDFTRNDIDWLRIKLSGRVNAGESV